MAIAIDAAASSFYKDGKYILASEKDPERSAEDMIDFYEEKLISTPLFPWKTALTRRTGTGGKNS